MLRIPTKNRKVFFPMASIPLVESDRESSVGKWAENVDFYRLKLDGSGQMDRLTFFAESGQFKGANPVVSDEGRFIAFQVPSATREAGLGQGLYIYDIEKARKAKIKPWTKDTSGKKYPEVFMLS